MSDIIQLTIAGVVVALAAIYLIRRLTRPKGGCGCGEKCGKCPHADE